MICLTFLPWAGNCLREIINRIHSSSRWEKAVLEEQIGHCRAVPLYESGKLAAGEKGLMFDPYEQSVSVIILYQKELTGRMNHKLNTRRNCRNWTGMNYVWAGRCGYGGVWKICDGVKSGLKTC